MSFTKVSYHFAGVESKRVCTQSEKLDMQILVDASGSVGEENFNTMMKVIFVHGKGLQLIFPCQVALWNEICV